MTFRMFTSWQNFFLSSNCERINESKQSLIVIIMVTSLVIMLHYIVVVVNRRESTHCRRSFSDYFPPFNIITFSNLIVYIVSISIQIVNTNTIRQSLVIIVMFTIQTLIALLWCIRVDLVLRCQFITLNAFATTSVASSSHRCIANSFILDSHTIVALKHPPHRIGRVQQRLVEVDDAESRHRRHAR